MDPYVDVLTVVGVAAQPGYRGVGPGSFKIINPSFVNGKIV